MFKPPNRPIAFKKGKNMTNARASIEGTIQGTIKGTIEKEPTRRRLPPPKSRPRQTRKPFTNTFPYEAWNESNISRHGSRGTNGRPGFTLKKNSSIKKVNRSVLRLQKELGLNANNVMRVLRGEPTKAQAEINHQEKIKQNRQRRIIEGKSAAIPSGFYRQQNKTLFQKILGTRF
jgi:hypothetical protein